MNIERKLSTTYSITIPEMKHPMYDGNYYDAASEYIPAYAVEELNTKVEIDTSGVLGGPEKYCQRRDPETIKNLKQIKKVVTYIAGVSPQMDISSIGPHIEEAGIKDDQRDYEEMRLRCNQVLMPLLNLDPENPVAVGQFETLFAQACKAADEAVMAAKRMMEQVAHDTELGRMDMMQESTYATTPLLLLENIFRELEPKRSYESLRKFMMAFRMMPEILSQDKLKTAGIGNDIFYALTKDKVFGHEPLVEREIIAKVYEDTGECVAWEPFDSQRHIQLQSGVDEVWNEDSVCSRPWKEMSFTLPSRTLQDGLPVNITGRDKSDASTTIKKLRKLETSDDQFAVRLVFDETRADISSQIANTFQNMIDSFERKGWKVQLPTEHGFTNTIAEEIQLTVGGKQVVLPRKENGHNSCSSSDRHVCQIDWVITTSVGTRMQFEVQTMDTLAEINRRVNSVWNDESYKVTQFLEPFKYYNEACIGNALFPPYYMHGEDIIEKYKSQLYEQVHKKSLAKPSNNMLPV